jgi:alpha-glucuronidase
MNSEKISDEWIRMTFSNDKDFIDRTQKMMLSSREFAVNYMTPLGLHHIMYDGWHYRPSPWVNRGRQDWTSVYYHRADSAGVGFERGPAGSNATEQYFPEVRKVYENIETCPENLLLWFHHVPWTYKMSSGRTLWDELCYRYNNGVDSVRWMQREWEKSKGIVDIDRYEKVKNLLAEQEKNAKIWRDACLLYFQSINKLPVAETYEKPEHSLDYYMKIRYTNNGLMIE